MKTLSEDLPVEGEFVKPRLLCTKCHPPHAPIDTRVLAGLWSVESMDVAKDHVVLKNQGWNNLAKGLLVTTSLSMYDWTAEERWPAASIGHLFTFQQHSAPTV